MRTNRSEFNAHAAIKAGAAVPARRKVAKPRGMSLGCALSAMGFVLFGVALATLAAPIIANAYRTVTASAATYELVRVTNDGDVYVLDSDMSRTDCRIAQLNAVDPLACRLERN